MGVVSGLTGDTVPFRWGYTHQRAFEDVKKITASLRDHRREPVVYGEDADLLSSHEILLGFFGENLSRNLAQMRPSPQVLSPSPNSFVEI
ncbi:hypothetical protein B0H13DRAFT_2301680 [Mycena leptocephala]|nr:hypothetical protein B0H13DRAFT_2301680 [Mycena leptocephala]